MDPVVGKVSGLVKVWNDQYAWDNRSPPSIEVAQVFFDCCEFAEGWAGCSQYVTDENAVFRAQTVDALPHPSLGNVTTVKDYLEWVKNSAGVVPYTVQASAWGSETNTAMFFAVARGYSDYVYVIEMDPVVAKVSGVVKVWNDQYARD